jgi:hypothetical protein
MKSSPLSSHLVTLGPQCLPQHPVVEHPHSTLYVQVTVHRDNLRINNQQDASSIQNFILSRNKILDTRSILLVVYTKIHNLRSSLKLPSFASIQSNRSLSGEMGSNQQSPVYSFKLTFMWSINLRQRLTSYFTSLVFLSKILLENLV